MSNEMTAAELLARVNESHLGGGSERVRSITARMIVLGDGACERHARRQKKRENAVNPHAAIWHAVSQQCSSSS